MIDICRAITVFDDYLEHIQQQKIGLFFDTHNEDELIQVVDILNSTPLA
jgi:hypothetical protein